MGDNDSFKSQKYWRHPKKDCCNRGPNKVLPKKDDAIDGGNMVEGNPAIL